MSVHGYVRASTNKQRESPEIQQETIRAYCQAHGLLVRHDYGKGVSWEEPYWYIDPATSGKVMLRDREAGRVLCKSLRKGDHVVIAKLDRAFRRLSDCVQMLDEFTRLGVQLHVCNLMGGAIDLSSPMGRFIIQVLAAFAELERAFIAERTSEAMKARKRRGLGGGRAHYGFKHETRYRMVDGKREKYVIEVENPKEREVMRMILAWRTEKPPWSWDQIREKINYELKIRTTDGREWDVNRIKRAAKAEAILQFKEVTSGTCHERSR